MSISTLRETERDDTLIETFKIAKRIIVSIVPKVDGMADHWTFLKLK